MKNYWNVSINNGNDLLEDQDGNTLQFSSKRECKEYIEENEIDGEPIRQY